MLTPKAIMKPIRPYKKSFPTFHPDTDSRQRNPLRSSQYANSTDTSSTLHFQYPVLMGAPPPFLHDQHFKTWWASLQTNFPNRSLPLHIEIGCGQGLHPIRWAQSHSQAGLVALERTQVKYSKLLSRLHSHQFPNIYPVNSDGTYWLPNNIACQSVERYYLLYPNPYPKGSQANKRWHRSPFFEWILQSLKLGGHIEMASNLPWYIEEAKLYCREHWNLKLVSEKNLSLTHDYKPQSHFEKKYLFRGEPCTHLIFQKK